MLVAIIGSLVGGALDYFNPKTRFLDWLAAWFYMPAALAWLEILSISSLTGAIGNQTLRWILWIIGLFLTAMLFNSMITWKLFIFRKIVTPISDDLTGLGVAAHKGFNGQLIGVIAAAAVLSTIPPSGGRAQEFIDATHGTVRSVGNWSAEKVGVDWLGFPGGDTSTAGKKGGQGARAGR